VFPVESDRDEGTPQELDENKVVTLLTSFFLFQLFLFKIFSFFLARQNHIDL